MSSSQEIQRSYEYVAYIDEAGDPGLTRVQSKNQSGASEWFVLSGVLARKEFEPEIPSLVGRLLNDLSVRQRSDLHYAKLSPKRREAACRFLSNQKFLYFVVCSNKKNMQGYQNLRAANFSRDPNWFYHWMARILLERITDFVANDSQKKYGTPKIVKLEFAHRGGLRFSKIGAYVEQLKIQTRGSALILNKRRIHPDVLDCMQVRTYQAKHRAGLQVADVVASAFYEAIDNIDSGPCVPSNAQILKPHIAFERRNGKKVVADYGVVLQPTPAWRVEIGIDQKAIFEFFGYDFSKKW